MMDRATAAAAAAAATTTILLLLSYYYYYYYYYFRCSAFCLTSHFPTTESDCLLLSYISNELQLHDFCSFRWGTFCVTGIFVFNK